MSTAHTNVPAPTPLNFDDGSRIMRGTKDDASQTNSAAAGGAIADSQDDGHASPHTCTAAGTPTCRSSGKRGSTPLEYYYEIDRLASEVVGRLGLLGAGGDGGGDGREIACLKAGKGDKAGGDSDTFLCRVALQFPDELLADAAQVSQLLERALTDLVATCPAPPLIFILGDTTYGACCPDEIGAAHLDADILVHFGTRACLGPTETLPVVYSFGRRRHVGCSGRSGGGPDEVTFNEGEEYRRNGAVDQCVNLVMAEVAKARGEGVGAIDSSNDTNITSLFLILYEIQHWELAETVAARLVEQQQIDAVCGRIPDYPNFGKGQDDSSRPDTTSCRGISDDEQTDRNTGADTVFLEHSAGVTDVGTRSSSLESPVVIGGLVLPSNIRLSDYTLLYIGGASGEKSGSRQFLNILLRCCSPGGTNGCWAYDPLNNPGAINTNPAASSISISRYLNRRYYLIQKVKMASIVGILVGTLSQKRFRSVIDRVRLLVEASGRSCYTFAVGKVNVAKLANYAEIEAFVLVGCTESSVLDDERDFHVPIVTPMEMEVAFGKREWDGFYSHTFSDFLGVAENSGDCNGGDKHDNGGENEDGAVAPLENDVDESDDDEPFFSPISGKYESVGVGGKATRKHKNDIDLRTLPGGGQVTEYKSGAAEFWQDREYKGLEAAVGTTEVKAAVHGQTGIASDYGETTSIAAKRDDATL